MKRAKIKKQERVKIKYNVKMFLENYKGLMLYKEHPDPEGPGYDPAFVIYFTMRIALDGRPRFDHRAYSMEDLKKEIDIAPKKVSTKRVKLKTKRVKLKTSRRKKK